MSLLTSVAAAPIEAIARNPQVEQACDQQQRSGSSGHQAGSWSAKAPEAEFTRECQGHDPDDGQHRWADQGNHLVLNPRLWIASPSLR